METFRAAHGDAWRFTVDLRRGVTSLLDGGAIPFIPGRANDLAWEDFAPGCSSYDCLPVATVEALARDFIDANSEALGLRSSRPPARPGRLGTVRRSPLLPPLRLDGRRDAGRPRLGLLPHQQRQPDPGRHRAGRHVGARRPTDPHRSATPSPSSRTTSGPFGGADDQRARRGLAADRAGDPGRPGPRRLPRARSAAASTTAWPGAFAFIRKDVIGTWEAAGRRPHRRAAALRRHQPLRPHPRRRLPGRQPRRRGRPAVPVRRHRPARAQPVRRRRRPVPGRQRDHATCRASTPGIDDSCGAISNTTTTGDVDFSLGSGTDCAVPAGNTGGRRQHPLGAHPVLPPDRRQPAGAGLAAGQHLAAEQLHHGLHQPVAVVQRDLGRRHPQLLQGGLRLLEPRRDPRRGAPRVGPQPRQLRRLRRAVDAGRDLRRLDGGAPPARLLRRPRLLPVRQLLAATATPAPAAAASATWTTRSTPGNTPWTAANYGTLWSGCSQRLLLRPVRPRGPLRGRHRRAGAVGLRQPQADRARRSTWTPRTAWLLADRLWYLVIPTLGTDMYTCSSPELERLRRLRACST